MFCMHYVWNLLFISAAVHNALPNDIGYLLSMEVTDCSFICSGHSYVQLFKMCIWKHEFMSPLFFV